MSSDVELNDVGVLKRREIEARILAPLLKALGDEFGHEQVLEVARKTIASIARQQGKELAEGLKRNDLEAYSKAIEPWSHSGALQLRILDQNDRTLNFDVTACQYADLYRNLGIEELGSILSCERDAAFVEGFNPSIALQRTQTIMRGAPHCDFRYHDLPRTNQNTGGTM